MASLNTHIRNSGDGRAGGTPSASASPAPAPLLTDCSADELTDAPWMGANSHGPTDRERRDTNRSAPGAGNASPVPRTPHPRGRSSTPGGRLLVPGVLPGRPAHHRNPAPRSAELRLKVGGGGVWRPYRARCRLRAVHSEALGRLERQPSRPISLGPLPQGKSQKSLLVPPAPAGGWICWGRREGTRCYTGGVRSLNWVQQPWYLRVLARKEFSQDKLYSFIGNRRGR